MPVVRRDDLHVTPWRNGLGRKADVAEGEGWFVGLAWIESDVAFSHFEGMDRTTVLLDGDGFALDLDGLPPAVFDAAGRVRSYPGDVAAAVRLAGGTCTVFNVMTRRGVLAHRVEVGGAVPTQGFAVVLRGEFVTSAGTAAVGDVLVPPCTGTPSADLVVVTAEVVPAGGRP